MAGSPHAASSVVLETFTQLTATFDLTGVPQGVYSVVASNPGGSTSELSARFTVTAKGGMGMLETHLILPAKMGRHFSSTIEVEYSNVGTAAIAAPLLVLESARPQDVPLLTLDSSLVVSGFWTSAAPVGYSPSVEILASGNQVPGWIEPGESVTVPVYYAGMQRPWNLAETNFQFKLLSYTQKDQKLNDWSTVESGLQPPGVSTQVWSAIFAGVQSEIGPTIGDYVTALDNEATYLGQLGQNVTNVGQLWSLAVMQVDGLTPSPVLANLDDLHMAVPAQIGLDFVRSYAEPTSSREELGPLGYGWTDNWQYSLTAAADGTVTVTLPTGQQRVFQPDSRGSDYFATPGDHGILIKGSGGTFVLQETNGQAETFNADGTLNYIQDSNGNRITAVYTSGRLSSLKASNGDPATNPVVASLTIGYNAAGLIGSVQSSDGRTVTYNYDPGKHLIGVTSFDGEVTQYGYQGGSNAATKDALASITYADGSQNNFSYDSVGRLSATSQAGGASAVTYAYQVGGVTLTDASGAATLYDYNGNGELIRIVDPLGNVSVATYDANFNLASATGPTGLTTSYSYSNTGELTSVTNALGQTTTYTYSSIAATKGFTGLERRLAA